MDHTRRRWTPGSVKPGCTPARRLGAFVLGGLVLLGASRAGAQQASSPGGSRQAAITAFQQGDLDRAERLSLAWLETHPRDAEILRLLGMVRITSGLDLEARERPRSEYLAVYRNALEALLEAEKLAPGVPQPDLNHAVGYILMSEGRYREATARLTRAIEEAPGNFVLYRLRGTCRLELGQYIEAEADLGRAVELNGRDWTSRVLHARALNLVGQGQAAREGLRDYRRLVENEATDERRFEVLYETYRYSKLLNDTEAARADLEQACRLDPANTICRTELGALYYQLGLPELAIPELEAVLAAPRAPKALRADALYYRGMIARQQREYERARRWLAEALELAPTRSDALLSYGATLRDLGETDEARRVHDRFRAVAETEKDMKRLSDRLRLDPSEREARVEWVGLLIELERWPESREQLDELRRRHPGDPAIPKLAGRIPSASPTAGVDR